MGERGPMDELTHTLNSYFREGSFNLWVRSPNLDVLEIESWDLGNDPKKNHR